MKHNSFCNEICYFLPGDETQIEWCGRLALPFSLVPALLLTRDRTGLHCPSHGWSLLGLAMRPQHSLREIKQGLKVQRT